jgi:Methyltransferase domain
MSTNSEAVSQGIERAEALLRDLPALHHWGGEARVGGLDYKIGKRLMTEVQRYDAPRVIETGAGASTLLFCCLEPAALTSIAPNEGLRDRTLATARERDIPTDSLRFLLDYSELALPKLVEAGEQYDVAFIDGCHNWPLVFVDFCYLNMMLPAGGTLILDDLHLYSVEQLFNLLRLQEDQFEYASIDNKTATFRKRTDARSLPEWNGQPYILHNTLRPPD